MGFLISHLVGIIVLVKTYFLPLETIGLHLGMISILWFSLKAFSSLLKIVNANRFIFSASMALYFVGCIIIYVGNYFTLSEWGDYVSYKTLDIIWNSKNEIIANFKPELLLGSSVLLIAFLAPFFRSTKLKQQMLAIAFKRNASYRIRIFELLCLGLIFVVVSNSFRARTRLKLKGEPIYNFISPALSNIRKISKQQQLELNKIKDRLKSTPFSEKPNVVLIVVDALRYDRLKLNKYSRATTPFIDSISTQMHFKTFHEIRSNCATSYCGILSILSGTPIYKPFASSFKIHDALTLLGYKSHFLLSGAHNNWYQLRRAYEFHNSLDTYLEGGFNKLLDVSDDAAVIQNLQNLEMEQLSNNFFYIHLMSTHRAGIRKEKFKKYKPHSPFNFLKPDSIVFSNNYDNGVLQTDYYIKEIINQLKVKGLWENSMVFITADHGESLGENNKFGHSVNVSEANIKIPLLYFSEKYPLDLDTHFPLSQRDYADLMLGQIFDQNEDEIWRANLSSFPKFSFHRQMYNYAALKYTQYYIYKLTFNDKEKELKLYELKNDPKELHPISLEINTHVVNELTLLLHEKFQLNIE